MVLNSTIGISGLQRGYPSIALARPFMRCAGWLPSQEEQDLDDFWSNPQKPCPETPAAFLRKF